MTRPENSAGLEGLTRPHALAFVWLPMLLIAALHYGTPPHHHWVHDVARRLFYLPIVLGAFQGGRWGGLAVALIAVLLYLPHAVGGHAMAVDPGSATEKLLETLLYLVLGGVAGALVDRERREQARQQALADRLQRALEEARQMEAQLVRAGRLESLGQLTAGLAHEIRNPLHAMRGSAEILLDAVDPTTDEGEAGRSLVDEIDRLSALLKRFLGFARGGEIAPQPVDLLEVARAVEGLLRAQVAREEVTLEVLDGPPLVVEADRDQLIQVALGIALNALQARPAPRRIRLSAERRATAGRAFAALVVENDGPPLPEAMEERIFDPFVTTRDDGTGLGLTVAWRIVDGHGGFIEAENVEGGVAFRVLLPLREPAAA